MPAELTLETLGKNIEDLKVLVGGIKLGEEEDEKKKQEIAKKAEDEKKEEEKMEAKKAKYNAAIKLAMEEDNHDKKMAMVRKAQDEMEDKKHDAQHDEKKEHEATEEEKEKEAQIASIINDKKNEFITKILTANSIMNPTQIKQVEERLKTASITEVEKEWNILKPAFEGSVAQPTQNTQKIIPFYANITPGDIDANQLTAASPDSDFTKLSTKELLEGTN